MTASVTTSFAFFRLLSVPYPSVQAISYIPASIQGGKSLLHNMDSHIPNR